jgi:hypothetical protein
MRNSIVFCAIVASVHLNAAAQQEKTSAALPKKGDTIVVKGCLNGGALESTDFANVDATGEVPDRLTFRLTGDKARLKQLRDKYDGKLVDVEGVLKSDLSQQGVQTRRIGKMRVTIGAPPSNPAAPDAQAKRSLPVLEVKSFEGGATSCGR